MLTVEAQSIFDKHQPQSQLEFYHLFHQKDKREPDKHLLRLLHHLNESDARVLVELALSARKRFMKISALKNVYLWPRMTNC